MALASAHQLPLRESDVDVLVSSLGDAYNLYEFWAEAHRVLKPDGSVIFTTPSHEWASGYRRNADGNVAEFELADSRHVYAPSFVWSLDAQVELMRQSGFRLLWTMMVKSSQLDQAPTSKKLLLADLEDAPIVTGYLARKF